MGLLDIWKDWRSGAYSPKGYEWGSQETDVGNLNTAGGVKKKSFQETMMKNNQWRNQNPYKEADNSLSRKEKLIKAHTPNQNNFFNKIAESSKEKNIYIDAQGNKRSRTTGEIITTQDASKTPFHPSQGDIKYHGGNEQEQLKWWQVLANKIGFDYDKAAATWKQKGGFEGLMANPAFTMGLAFMQAGAEGKTLGQGALDNVMKAGGISQHYKQILKDRAEEPIQATAADMAEVEDLLGSINIKEGNWLENLVSKARGGNPGAEWSAAVEEISLKYQEKVRAKQKALAKAGKPQTLRRSDKLKIMQELIDSGVIKKKKSLTGGILTAHTLSMPGVVPKAEGGPIEAGKPYIVGEKGPEVIIPKSDGNVIANDDSQIFAMLLASNPQLQNVSRQRAERILRSRFPEYFE